MLRKTIILSLLALLTAACIKEDLSRCEDDPDGRTGGGISATMDSARINLRYAYDGAGQHTLGSRARSAKLYIYDEELGFLLRTENISAAALARGYASIPYLPVGRYTMVAWAYSGASMAASGYTDARADSAAGGWSYTVPMPAFGDNSLSNHRMALVADSIIDSRATAAPRVRGFDSLFHALTRSVPIVRFDSGQVADLSFARNTAVLDVRIKGASSAPGAGGASILSVNTKATTIPDSVNVYVIGKNSGYTYDNQIDNRLAKSMIYEPYEQARTDSTTNAKIKVQRLDLRLTDSIMLHVRSSTGGALITPINVIQALGKVKDERDGSYPYRAQENIDRVGVFPIEITLTPSGFSIVVRVNEWQVSEPEVILM